MVILAVYITIFLLAYIAYGQIAKHLRSRQDFNERKMVTFGDESAIRSNRAASVISVLSLFIIWGAFTGSVIIPVHVPGPYVGETTFTYTALNGQNQSDDATVHVTVKPQGDPLAKPENMVEAREKFSANFAADDSVEVAARRSVIVRVKSNDEGGKYPAYHVVAVNGESISAGQKISVDHGSVSLTQKGSLSFVPEKGMQMDPIWLPPPEDVFMRLIEIARDGYQNVTLFENVGWSLLRVLAGFVAGSLVGIPLGYAMGLSHWFRGWFDPIVEFMRPVPPLALIPLVIIWFGIWEIGKISLLFLAALWIMTIAARSGVSGVSISKIHAAYSLGASKSQILMHVIIPNSLPEIFTGARLAMGVCWGTVVAAELVAAQKGAGKMIIAASKFQQTDIVIMGIIIIGIIGYSIDVLMRRVENYLVPWKGKS